MKLICVKCKIKLEPEKNGVYVEEMLEPELINSYRIWNGDKWKCPNCGYEIMAGFPPNPVRREHERNYHEFQKDVELKFF